jgi:hypothetical protein
MTRHGVPSEVLTDNGKQFTGRFTKPYPAEVLFERICRENGITTGLTKPRSPTRTGKIERWHKTLCRELLDAAGAFSDVETAQASIDAWVNGFNHTPAASVTGHGRPGDAVLARSHRTRRCAADAGGPTDVFSGRSCDPPQPVPAPASVVHSDSLVDNDIHAVEWEADLTPRARLVLPGNQQMKFTAALARRTVTIWANDRSIHVMLDGR